VVRHILHRIAIMYAGKIMEIASRNYLHQRPLHPYTLSLLSVVPVPDPRVLRACRRITYARKLPNPLELPPGSRY
jgi:ABC-type oligopeptide transport system ATPase subunit